ncbi:MAG TPA: ATP-binding protein [Candidatus Saccharimonadia bacterium]|nr:ATP-binding protein [Candidatus Saccharimonadia bacterium]
MRGISEAELTSLVQEAIQSNGETNLVEFKDTRGGLPDIIWRSITAFSNKAADGGLIVYGVVEDPVTRTFAPVGVTNVHEMTERTTNFFSDRIINAERPEYRAITIDGKTLLAVVIDAVPDERKPCYDRKLGMDRGAYIRVGNSNRPITDDELRQFIRNSSGFKYDLTQIRSIHEADLSQDKIQHLIHELGERTGRENAIHDDTLLNMKILAICESERVATLAGAMIFSSNPPQRNPELDRYVIRCVRYAGPTTASEIIDKQDLHGTLEEQIDTMNSFVLRNIARSATIEGTRRVETYAYPEKAIREIAANAVIHRDYSIIESYIQVRVFPDRIEISNPGTLPPRITVDNIREAQFSRNSVIAALMKDLGYLEEYGRGIDLVYDYMRQVNLSRPIFRNVANMFTVTLLGPTYSELTERQLAIWQIILNKSSATSRDIVQTIGSITRPTVIADINKLIELDLVAQRGQGPSTTYEIGNH